MQFLGAHLLNDVCALPGSRFILAFIIDNKGSFLTGMVNSRRTWSDCLDFIRQQATGSTTLHLLMRLSGRFFWLVPSLRAAAFHASRGFQGWSRFTFHPTLFALTQKAFFLFSLFPLQIFLTSILRYPRTTSAYLFCFLFSSRTGGQEADILGSNQALHSAGGNMGYGERGSEAKKILLEGKTVSICERWGEAEEYWGKVSGYEFHHLALGLASE